MRTIDAESSHSGFCLVPRMKSSTLFLAISHRTRLYPWVWINKRFALASLELQLGAGVGGWRDRGNKAPVVAEPCRHVDAGGSRDL